MVRNPTQTLSFKSHQAFQPAGRVDAVRRIEMILSAKCRKKVQYLEMDQLLIFVEVLCMVFQ